MGGPRVAVLGECMLELSPADAVATGRSFRLDAAGDTYNTAAALARLGCSTQYLTALGGDRHSDFILAQAAAQGVDTRAVQRCERLQPGLYLIDNDERGERYFSYWRRGSAAHETLRDPAQLLPLLENAQAAPYFYLSGISLALCEERGRRALWSWLRGYRAAGGTVVYDSNYREALWPALAQARSAHLEMLEHTDIFLPGVADELRLRELTDRSALGGILADLTASEVVLKDGGAQVTVYEGGKVSVISPEAVAQVVDASGAGDAFNGAYLAARIHGLNTGAAAGFACTVSAAVIQHRGAVLPAAAWQLLRDQLRHNGPAL